MKRASMAEAWGIEVGDVASTSRPDAVGLREAAQSARHFLGQASWEDHDDEAAAALVLELLDAALAREERPPLPPRRCRQYHGVPGCRCQVSGIAGKPHKGPHHCEIHDFTWTAR